MTTQPEETHSAELPSASATSKGEDPPTPAMKRWLGAPATGGTVAGTVVLGAALLWGPLEAALGAGAAYAAYKYTRKRRASARAGTNTAEAAPSEGAESGK
jgi:hypothetical protein